MNFIFLGLGGGNRYYALVSNLTSCYFLKISILGTSNDSWTGGSIVSQLNPDILVKIQHCFMVSINHVFGDMGGELSLDHVSNN